MYKVSAEPEDQCAVEFDSVVDSCTSANRISASGCLHFRATAHAALPPDHHWLKRVRRASLLLPESLPSAPSESLPVLACARAGVGRLEVRPRSLPRYRQRLCPRPSAWIRPSRASEPSPLLSYHALPLFAALAVSCFACVPLPLSPLGPPSFLSLCALGLPPVAWALTSFDCQVCVTRPDTAGGNTCVERCWRCVQHFLFSCKDSPPACPDPTNLWLDLLDLLSCDAVAVLHVRQALHVDSFDPADVRGFCMPWLLDPFCFLSACPRSVSVAVSSILASYVLLVGASVADAAVPAG
jgi:hypothetical protein